MWRRLRTRLVLTLVEDFAWLHALAFAQFLQLPLPAFNHRKDASVFAVPLPFLRAFGLPMESLC